MQENKTMTVYAAKCTGNATNCLYPTRVNLTDEEIARKAFSRDTVFAEYKGNYRSNDNFIRFNVIPSRTITIAVKTATNPYINRRGES